MITITARIKQALGLSSDASNAEAAAAATRLHAEVDVAKAIAERRLHRAQRGTMLALAARDFATFLTTMAGLTEVIGYPTAAAEFVALTRSKVKSSNLTVAQAQTEIAREHPELVREIDDERARRLRASAQARHDAGDVLARKFREHIATGTDPKAALALVAKENPEIARIHASEATTVHAMPRRRIPPEPEAENDGGYDAAMRRLEGFTGEPRAGGGFRDAAAGAAE